VLGQGFLNFWLESLQQQTVNWVTHSLQVEREGERLLSAALDEQTSLRGYLITKDASFLEPYRTKAQANFSRSLHNLQSLVQDNRTQLRQINQIQAIYDNWQTSLLKR
jgi:CHASE3 domain sensor protein